MLIIYYNNNFFFISIIIIFKTFMLQKHLFDSMLKGKILNFIDESLKIAIIKLVTYKN